MNENETRVWNTKLSLLENTEQLQTALFEMEQYPISFYEALSIYLAEAYSKSQTNELLAYSYQGLAA